MAGRLHPEKYASSFHRGCAVKFKAILSIVFFVCLFFVSLGFIRSQTVTQDNMTTKELEIYLKTAKIAPDKQSAGRRTESYVVSLNDGKTTRTGFIKLTNRTRPHPLADSYKYEIAAYELDKLLDLNLVPPTVEREIERRKGALRVFLENVLYESDRRRKNIEPPDQEGFNKTLDDIIVFENLAYSPALCGFKELQALDDILIMVKEDWKVWRVDFSEAFGPSAELFPDCKIIRCSRKLYQNLKKLDSKSVKRRLKSYLNDDEIAALLKRKDLIIEKIENLIKEKGEGSVLFS